MAITPKDEVLTALDTASTMLGKPLDAMSLFLIRQTLAFARERVDKRLTVRKKPAGDDNGTPPEPDHRHRLVLLGAPEPDPNGGGPFIAQCTECDDRFKEVAQP